MEIFFLKQVVSTLSPPPIASPASCSMELTCIEENAMLYNAGYVKQRVERRYSEQKSQEEVECMRELKEMVGKISSCPVTAVIDLHSGLSLLTVEGFIM